MAKQRGNPTGKGGFGDHPENRNRYGQLNPEAVAFTRKLREALVAEGETPLNPHGRKTKYQKMIEQVWALATLGTEWAVKYISERVEGKVPDKLQVDDQTYRNYLLTLNNWIHNLNPQEEEK